MNRSWIAVSLALLALPAAVRAADAQPAEARTAAEPGGGGLFNFLLPKSLQKNPKLDFNIITEMTADGRRAGRPTTQKPAFYIAQSGGMHNAGIGAEESLRGPTEENLQRMITRALAANHYHLSSGAAQPPTIAVIYHFGSHSFQPPASVADASAETAEEGAPPPPVEMIPETALRKALLERAKLIGGAKFLKEVADAMHEVDRLASMEKSFVAPTGSEGMGSVASMVRDPFDVLRNKSAEHERLVDELFSSSFFVVASAYDYAALAKGQRRLLWRTKMTVNSLGVNMVESLPPLIATAGPYLGRETPEPVVISKRIMRDGNVEIGEAVVVEGDATLSRKGPANPKKK